MNLFVKAIRPCDSELRGKRLIPCSSSQWILTARQGHGRFSPWRPLQPHTAPLLLLLLLLFVSPPGLPSPTAALCAAVDVAVWLKPGHLPDSRHCACFRTGCCVCRKSPRGQRISNVGLFGCTRVFVVQRGSSGSLIPQLSSSRSLFRVFPKSSREWTAKVLETKACRLEAGRPSRCLPTAGLQNQSRDTTHADEQPLLALQQAFLRESVAVAIHPDENFHQVTASNNTRTSHLPVCHPAKNT